MTPTDLMDSKAIAQLLGVNRDHCVARILKRPDFPAPAINVSRRLKKWKRADVLRWASGVK